jgi:hypothetical protein
MNTGMSQEGHGLDTVGGYVQLNGPVRVAKRLLRKTDITGTIFDQQDL